jgi:hypothetical protein
MKPFDLERAKAGDPIVTRDGREAKFIAYAPKAQLLNEQVVFLLDRRIKTTCPNGFSYPAHENKSDLFMAPKKRTVWVNLYPDSQGTHWRTEEAANIAAGNNRIGDKSYPVEVEE